MTNEFSAFLKEYEVLRSEIETRMVLQHAILAAALTATGAVVSVLSNAPEALLGLGLLLTYLWILWLDHSLQIYRIAAYTNTMGRKFVPSGSNAMSWEWWYRHSLPYGVKTGVGAGAVTTKLFVVGVPAVVGWYVVDRLHAGLGQFQWLWLVAAGIVLLGYGYVALKVYRHDWRHALESVERYIKEQDVSTMPREAV